MMLIVYLAVVLALCLLVLWWLKMQAQRELLDWAETLLCNSEPMSHCSKREWDKIVHQWRDHKHGVYKPQRREGRRD